MPYQREPKRDVDVGGRGPETDEEMALRGQFGAPGFVAALPEAEGNPNYVYVGNKMMLKADLIAVLSTPEGQKWMKGITKKDFVVSDVDIYGNPLYGVNRFDEPLPGTSLGAPPPIERKLGELATIGVGKGIWGRAVSDVAGRPILPQGEGQRIEPFDLQPEFEQFVGEQQLSLPKLTWMKSIFPQLTGKFKQALPQRPQTKQQMTSLWSQILHEYPFEEEWNKLTPQQRGWRAFQPKIRQVGL
jgi:hypothetical protein